MKASRLNCTRSFGVAFSLIVLTAVAALGSWNQIQAQTQPSQIMGIGNTTSTPVPGVPHDYLTGLNEIVNPANGALSIRLKAPTPHERGVNWPTYLFTYDSDGQFGLSPYWFTFQQGTGTFSEITNLQLIWAGVGNPTGVSTQQTMYVGPPDNQTMYVCQITSGHVYTDPDGGRHGLGLQVATPITGGPSACQYIPGGTSNYYQGGDIHYRAVVDPSTLIVRVADNHGNLVTVANPTGGSTLAPPEDVNGNDFNTTGRTWSTTQTSTGYTSTIPGVSAPYTFTTGTTSKPSFALNFTPVNGNSACAASAITLTGPGGVNPTIAGFGVKTIKLPNGESYQLQYDSTFGLINKIVYPTGAWVQYTWSVIPNAEGVQYHAIPGGTSGGLCAITHDWFAITKRVVSYDGTHSAEEQDFSYSTTWPASGQSNSYQWTSKTTTVTTKDLLRGTSFNTVYSYSPMLPPAESPGPSAWEQLGVVPQENTIAYKDTNGSLLKTVTKTWQSMSLMSGECETLPNGQTSGKFYTYQQYNPIGFEPLNPEASWTDLPTDVAEYDYGAVASTCAKPASTPMRETKTTYASFSSTPLFPFPSILDRPATVQVYGNGTLLSETDYGYDETALTAVNAYGQDTAYQTSGQPRGNVTSVKQCIAITSNACAAFAITTYAYDTTGQVLSVTDPCGNSSCSDMTGTNHSTQYSYVDNYTTDTGTGPGNTNAYVTKITDSLGHAAQFKYGFNDGKLRSKIDANSQTTTFCITVSGCGGSTFETFYRLTGVTYPDGGQESVSYSDAGPNPSVTTNRLLNSSWLTSKTIYDAMGHSITSELTTDPFGTDYTQTTYDGLGHVWTVTNPYRTTSDPTYGVTTHYYDALDRPTVQVQPDSSMLEWCYNDVVSTLPTGASNICSAHLGGTLPDTWVDSCDESGRTWLRTRDALGRLSEVMEPDGSATVGKTPTLETDYWNDALDNVTEVDQWGGAQNNGSYTDHQRTFTYDPLSRLIRSTNPESGQITYAYDANGNVNTKTEPAQNVTSGTVTVSYTYDVLNRLTQESYSDGATPNALFGYDTEALLMGTTHLTTTNVIGRPSWTCGENLAANTCVTMRALSYDQMGRLTQLWQCPNTTCTPSPIEMLYTYDRAGSLQSRSNGITSNPITVSYTYDGAEHLQKITSNQSSYSLLFANATSPASYDAFGHLVNAGLDYNSSGQPIMSLLRQYDNRGRVTSETDRDGPSSGSGTVLYSFTVPSPTSTTGYAPNGNLLSVNDTVLGNWSYGYDNMSRLTSANVTSGSYDGTNIAGAAMSWTYDPFGNRLTQGVTGTAALQSAWGQYNAANNKLTANNFSPSLPPPDAAGDINSDGRNNYLYDAEGRICAVKTALGGVTGYIYDSDGAREMKGSLTSFSCNGSTNGFSLTNSYILGAEGEQLSELDGSGNWLHTNVYNDGGLFATYTSGYQLHYHFSDWLGSRRIQTASSGSAEETCWNQPFGDNWACSGTDATEHHFTGKERDSESGNDYFGARYYASSMGRFMSPDWNSGPVAIPFSDLNDPQSLNLYGYVRNNPLSKVDADGHGFWRKLWTYMTTDSTCWCEGAKAVASAQAHQAALAAQHEANMAAMNSPQGRIAVQIAQAFAISEIGGALGAGPESASAAESTASETSAVGESWIRVGRWMSQEELDAMKASGTVQESTGGGGGSWVANPSDPNAYNAAKPGSLYVEYDVPASSVKNAGSGWGRIPGPNSIEGRLAASKGQPVPQLPAVRNIEVTASK